VKALFLGNVAAVVYPYLERGLPAALEHVLIADPQELQRRPEIAADADILVGNHWRAEYPPAPRLRLVQSVATGIDLFDLAALPKGAQVCNAFGHETAIAEYIVMVTLALYHRFLPIAGAFREHGSWAESWVGSGPQHGEIRATTIGIVGYGRVGRETAKRLAPFGVRILAANRTPRPAGPEVERVYPLAELDAMLPECDTVVLCTALEPETTGLIDRRRLTLMKPSAFLVNIARGPVVDEDALWEALRGSRLAGAAIDVWWRYPSAEEPKSRGSRHPFHELPNVIVTPHNSGWTEGTGRRRLAEIADNLNRVVRGDQLINLVTTI
jgi:phosphoglycerate dehydrogenase-like enzyme